MNLRQKHKKIKQKLESLEKMNCPLQPIVSDITQRRIEPVRVVIREHPITVNFETEAEWIEKIGRSG